MNKNGLVIALFFLFYVILTFFTSHNPFFWDTIQLGSQHAHWFYTTNFTSLAFPNEIDSGNTPAFGFYLAILWKLFGKSLPVSHFAMLPFLLGIVLQAYILCKRFLKPDSVLWGTLLLLAQPTLLAQSTLISPDIVLIFFYLLSLNAILNSNRIMLALALIGVGCISLRGIICVAILFACDTLLSTSLLKNKKWIFAFFKHTLVYLPIAILICLWLLWHYRQTAWIGYHSQSPWAEAFKLVTIKTIIRNIFVLAWRLIDFGMIAWFIALIPIVIIFYKNHKNKIALPEHTIKLLILFTIPLTTFAIVLTPYAELLGHRYLLPVYLTFSLFMVYHINYFFNRYKKPAYIIILLSILTGHLWIYPEKVAMGWDATLAHYPYYQQRKEMLNYLKEKNIPASEVGVGRMSAYCNYLLDLNNDTTCFNSDSLSLKKYILYSSTYNDYSDSLIDSLNNHWILEKEYKSPTAFLKLYRQR